MEVLFPFTDVLGIENEENEIQIPFTSIARK